MATQDLRRNAFGDAASGYADPTQRFNLTKPGTAAPDPGVTGTGPLAMPRGQGVTPRPMTREGAVSKNIPIEAPAAAPVAVPDRTPSPLTQAYVAGAQIANPPQPDFRPAAVQNVIQQVRQPEPVTMFSDSLPRRPVAAQSGFSPKPAAPQTPVASPNVMTPEQRLSQDIINNPTQLGTVVKPLASLTQQQKDQAKTDFNKANAAAPNNVVREGNSFSGKDIKFDGMTINGRTPGGTVSTLDFSGGRAFDNQMAAQYDARMAAEREAALRAPAFSSMGTRAPDGKLDGYGLESYASRRDDQLRDLMRGLGTGVNQRVAAMRTLADIQNNELDNQTSRANNESTNATSRFNNESTNATSRFNNESTNATSRLNNENTNATTRRGQDFEELASQRLAKSNSEKITFEALKAERESDNKLREGGDKRVNEFLQRRFVDPKTGETDGRRVADLQRGLTASLPTMIQKLKDAGETEYAARVERQGFGALKDSDMEQLAQLGDIRDRLRQSTGLGKNSKNIDSNDLLDYLPVGVSKDGTRVKLRNGSVIATEDMAYTEPANAYLPDLLKDRTSTYFNALPPELRQKVR